MPQRELILPLLLIGTMSHTVLAFIGYWLPRLFCEDTEKRGIYGFMLSFSNIGFIGYPVIASIFGHHALFYASILMLPYTVFAFTIGIHFISGKSDKHHFDYHILLSPMMIASWLAIIMVYSGATQTPTIISHPLQLIGNITIPAALFVIGASLAEVPFSKMFTKKSLYTISFLRLCCLPMLLYAIADALHFDKSVTQINTVLMGMPISTYGTMFCYKAQKDDTLMTLGTCLSTLLSILSIPLLLRLIM